MEFAAEREALVLTGKILLEKGLVARTWGNLSIKVDSRHFLITPSGRNYETVVPADLSLVSIADLSWEGPLKPSSEKELHARVYRSRPSVGAVIHTHQPAASALAAARKGFVLPGELQSLTKHSGANQNGEPFGEKGAVRLGTEVPCVPYALPTTTKLAKSVETALTDYDENVRCLLLSNHGAVCFGTSLEEALACAVVLEKAAEEDIIAKFRGHFGISDGSAEEIRDKALEAYANDGLSAASAGMSVNKADTESLLNAVRNRFSDATLQLVKTPYVEAAARRGKKVRPLLDDFAQLIGPTLPVVSWDGISPARIVRILKRRSAVLVGNLGCLCLGNNDSESHAVAMVAEKGCRAAVVTDVFGGIRGINPLETRIMRAIYLMKYSKKAT